LLYITVFLRSNDILLFIIFRWLHKSEERHLVVPLAAELFLYYAFFSNEKKYGG